ncbi:Mth938-like domain-containing protein [Stenotrophomonas sp. PS02298]|uniref:Mth938-like domain-containing protein n=1 Tax=Stenotrophomonas sp. PS02298 TaxID=2991424 RepID=UPI00249A0BEC|nr:Mth938-like domain-containing protein [Stenotrophomonas sp. PS02298]
MQFSRELPDYIYSLRSADGRHAQVNDRALSHSFILAPNSLIEDWPVASVAELRAEDLDVALELNPALVILGTGDKQIFPPAAIMAACLTRGIGIEVMNNASAARTYNVLAGENRRVVMAIILESTP